MTQFRPLRPPRLSLDSGQTPDEADEYALSRVAEIASAKYANPLSAEQDVGWVTMDDLDGDERSYR